MPSVHHTILQAEIVQRIAELVEDKTIEGVADVRDESDREGLRVVVEVRCDQEPYVKLTMCALVMRYALCPTR